MHACMHGHAHAHAHTHTHNTYTHNTYIHNTYTYKEQSNLFKGSHFEYLNQKLFTAKNDEMNDTAKSVLAACCLHMSHITGDLDGQNID